MKDFLFLVIVCVFVGGCVYFLRHGVDKPVPKPCPCPCPCPKNPVVVTDYPQAIAAAKCTGKPVFLFFSSTSCAPCQRMKSATLADPKVKTFLDTFAFPLYLDVEQNKDLARKFGVSGIPAYFLIDGNENVLKRGAGFKTPKEFIAWAGPLQAMTQALRQSPCGPGCRCGCADGLPCACRALAEYVIRPINK